MKLLTVLIVAFLFCSCSPNFYCKKCLDRGGIKPDTIWQTVTIEKTVHDTVTNEVERLLKGDTVTLVTTKWKIRERVDTVTNTVYREVECPDRDKEVPATIVNEIKTGYGIWTLIGTGVGVFLLMCVVVYVATRR